MKSLSGQLKNLFMEVELKSSASEIPDFDYGTIKDLTLIVIDWHYDTVYLKGFDKNTDYPLLEFQLDCKYVRKVKK